MPKYRLSINEIERAGNVHKLERDGFTREQIHKEMYKQTDGMSTPERRDLMKKLYTRWERPRHG